MLVSWLSKLLHLFPELCYMFPLALFIISGSWVWYYSILHNTGLWYGMIKLLAMRSIWYLYSALPSSLYFKSHLLDTINNCTFYLFSLERQSMGEAPSFSFPFSSRIIIIPLESAGYPWEVQTSMF